MSEQKQHVDIKRKLTLRQTLIDKAGSLPGAAYIPFIREGDIAAALYREKRIYGADIKPAMVKKAKARLPDANIIKADCDQYPFPKGTATFTLADFDSYSYPYQSFRSFFEGAKIGSQCILIFTDGQRQAIIRTGHYTTPGGEKKHLKTKTEKREVYNFYFNKTILPWFKEYIKPWHIVYITKYLRGPNLMYWGAVISKTNGKHPGRHAKDTGNIRPYKFDDIKKDKYIAHLAEGHRRGYAATMVGISRQTICDHIKADKEFRRRVSEAESDANDKVVNALFEAATSGNTTAIQVWLYNKDPKNWSDKRNIQLSGPDGGPITVQVDGRAKLLEAVRKYRERQGEAKEKG